MSKPKNGSNLKQLSQKAKWLKHFTEFQSLQQSEVHVSVDKKGVLEAVRTSQQKDKGFHELGDLINLLSLLACSD